MFRLTIGIVLVFISASTLATPYGDGSRSKNRACARDLAKSGDQNDPHDQDTSAQFRTLEALIAKAESQVARRSLTDEETRTTLIKPLRDRANLVLSASGYQFEYQKGETQQTGEVPEIVLRAFELARVLESLQSRPSARQWGNRWMQVIVPIDTPPSVLYERNDVSETPATAPAPLATNPVRRIELLAAKQLLLYRGQQLVSTLYGAVFRVSYHEADKRMPQTNEELNSKRLEFHKVDVPPKPASQSAKKMRIKKLADSLWAEIPEPKEGERQILLISDSVGTTVPLSADAAALEKAQRNEQEAHDFPGYFWKFVTEPLPY